MTKMMVNALNSAGCVPPLLLNLTVFGESKHVMLSLFARHEAILTNSPKSEVLCDLFCRLSFILIQSNARAIVARPGLVLDQEVDLE